jgi:hypothetical protein
MLCSGTLILPGNCAWRELLTTAACEVGLSHNTSDWSIPYPGVRRGLEERQIKVRPGVS